ncbi:Hypothetical predicted protein [Paramuricea clavata]|uniref:Uncharacterized protein n=1 Tax=Paramuricea clavata TaxID=317549 RepID=A0A6S7G4N6_PARCT|nr:Hypothetical predicted protein [Paramuricea clavata]
MLDPKEIEAAVVEHMKALEPSYHVLAKVDLRLAAFNQSTKPINTLGASGGNNVQAQGSAVHCRLPKMKLPEFSGDPLALQGFWDQFQVAIYSNTRISDMDKFNHLKECLKGESLSAVSGLTLNSENYQEAIEILKGRFGNEQILISAMLYNHVESCTAREDILPTDDSVQVQTRILFDSDSQRSYISDKVRSTLKLKAIRVEKVVIKTFGQAENSEVQKLDVVQLKVRNKSDARFTFVEALCVPTICNPLTHQSLSSVHELSEFAGLEFADFEHKQHQNLPVGILIGIDFYHVFIRL